MTSPNSEFRVPGAYTPDDVHISNLAPLTDVFLPPKLCKTSKSSSTLAKSANALRSGLPASAHGSASRATPNIKRKRACRDSRETTPLTEWICPDTNQGPVSAWQRNGGDVVDESKSGRCYTLAGQIGTNGASVSSTTDDGGFYSDFDYRRALGPKSPCDDEEPMSDSTVLGHANSTAVLEGWTVFHALGNAVGKLWDFCRSGTFKGFHAGGGAGYDWPDGKPPQSSPGRRTLESTCLLQALESEKDSGQGHTLPGSFPKPVVADPVHAKDEAVTERLGKRRQLDSAGDELGRNWVVVEQTERESKRQASRLSVSSTTHDTLSGFRPSAQKRGSLNTPKPDAASRRTESRGTRFGGGSGTPQRPGLRVSHAGSPKLSPREPASFAPSRLPISVPSTPPTRHAYSNSRSTSRRTNSPPRSTSSLPVSGDTWKPKAGRESRLQQKDPRVNNLAGGRPSTGHHGRRELKALDAHASRTKAAESDGREAINDSPRLDSEAKRLAAQKLAAERVTDAKIEAFNWRLEEMIRQGQEALGTTFDVAGVRGHEDLWEDDD